MLIFDEVKTGLCVAAGGATEKFGVVPDMVTMAKALGGGLPSGAIGGTEEVMEVVANGTVYQVGTYNGNPLGMAASRARLERSDDARGLRRTSTCSTSACWPVVDGVMEKYGLPGYTVGISSKGCVTFSAGQDHRLRVVQGESDGRARRSRLALRHEPRRST